MSYPEYQTLSSNFLVMYCKISGVSRNMKVTPTEFILAEFPSVLVRVLLPPDRRTDLQVLSFCLAQEMSMFTDLGLDGLGVSGFVRVFFGGGGDR